MTKIERSVLTLIMFLFMSIITGHSQILKNVIIENDQGLGTDTIVLSDDHSIILTRRKPLYSFMMNNNIFNSSEVNSQQTADQYIQTFENNLLVTFENDKSDSTLWNGKIIFENNGEDTISISNVVPFGEDNGSVYITGYGPEDLARAFLFRPGFKPVRVILPDNAWELGYSSFTSGSDYSVSAIARRVSAEGGNMLRYKTILPPKSKVSYIMYADVFKGDWQSGIRMIFRDKYLYDLEKFDNSLYERTDLAWIRESYLVILQTVWDREFYDRFTGKYTFTELIKKGISLFGNIDIFGIWASWPRIGLDPRTQLDLYRNLPGGTFQLRSFIRMLQQANTHFLIAYNPWDNISNTTNHYKELSQIITETQTDGVILDASIHSGHKLQAAADTVRKGVVVYSEGMANPKDMTGIISGRVPNSIYKSPELNLIKLIKPDFSIFRVCDIGEDIIHREIAVSFFNGYGTELNMFRPGGRDEHLWEDLSYLAKTTFILRQNNDAFLDNNWTPLIETIYDDVFVNRWKSGDKVVYTVLNMRQEGIKGKLFNIDKDIEKHYVSLWNHENILPVIENGKTFLPVTADGWVSAYSKTRREGSVDCIGEFPDILRSRLKGDSLKFHNSEEDTVIVWKGNPSYQTEYVKYSNKGDTTIRVKDIFGIYEGKIVLQLIKNKRLRDENVLVLKGSIPWPISRKVPTERASEIPSEMILVPGTLFSLNVTPNDNFVPYPVVNGDSIKIDSFLIDKYPVTNAQYYDFITKSGYRPADTARYLRHWQSGSFRQGQDNYPVVYVSYEDIMAYAKWSGKRLPSQAEWQLAAQGLDNRKWPWGVDFHGTYCNNAFGRPTPVDAFEKGQSPYGVADIVGNVWQMTNDLFFNGTNYFIVIRGGSYYKSESSMGNIPGGPQSLDKTQILLMVSPGFDRSETVGFRCVMDIDSKAFNETE